MKENIKSENLGLTPTKNYAWRKWASNALTAQVRRRGHNCGLTIDGLIAITPSHCPCCKKILVPQGSVKNSPTLHLLKKLKNTKIRIYDPKAKLEKKIKNCTQVKNVNFFLAIINCIQHGVYTIFDIQIGFFLKTITQYP